MPDIKNMEGPVKFKKGVELYFDPKKDMFYDPKKKKYVSEKDILALEEVDLFEKSEEYQKFFQSALKKFGIDSPAELDDEKKKEFFDYVDKNWEGDKEEDEEETIEEKEFKPHMMYDPKTGKAYKAEKPEDHERMKKLGYTHEKPKKEKDMEEIEESRIRLSSLMNGGALLYDRDEDPDDDKLATVKVKGNPKKDIKNGDDLVLSLMGKGKSKEKEILKSLKKYYPKSKVVKEETEISDKMQNYVDACGKDFTNWK